MLAHDRIHVFTAALALLLAGSCRTHDEPAHGEPPHGTSGEDRPARAESMAPQAANAAFASSVEGPPAGWSGPVFELSHAYPKTKPKAPTGGYPWKSIDFKTEPANYIGAVLAYARARLEPVDWQPTKLAHPDWFHAPWMASGPVSGSGREFIHGMTQERTSRPKELAPTQTSSFSNYAVGLYNAAGGYTFGRVWADPANPRTDLASFDDGAMAIKLLFTSATVAQVPFLKGSKEWQADVYDKTTKKRTPVTLRLLQVDVAVRDTNNPLTGWVFGTFFFDGPSTSGDPLDHLVPVGLMWGNDPGVAPGQPLTQTWIDPTASILPHFGWGGRLNGPVDNPMSSCLSCHSTAETPQASPMLPPGNATTAQRMNWFQNIPAGTPFDAGSQSLDYSLQMAVAVQNAKADTPHLEAAHAGAAAAIEYPVTRGD